MTLLTPLTSDTMSFSANNGGFDQNAPMNGGGNGIEAQLPTTTNMAAPTGQAVSNDAARTLW